MFASILGRAKAAVGDAVEKQFLRALILVPLVIAAAYALAGVTALLTEQFGRSHAYWIMAAGLGALGAVAAMAVFARERSQEAREAVRDPSPNVAREERPAARAIPTVDTSARANLTIFGVLRTAVSDWFKHRATRLGAALSYYSVFSLGLCCSL
jgi:predicted membrane-bound mannosyltransferase